MPIPVSTFPETIRRVLEAFQSEIRTALPGIVDSYDAATQTADVVPGLTNPILASDEDQDDLRERFPTLVAVPVVWPRSSNFYMHAPLSRGDGVLLVFNELDPGAWRSTGDVADPGHSSRHGMYGAVAIPGFVPRAAALSDADGTHPRIGIDGGEHIEFRSGEIRAAGTSELATWDGLATVVDALVNSPTTVNDGGAGYKAAISAAIQADPRWTNRRTTKLKGG